MRGKMKVERVISRCITKKIHLIKLKFNRSGGKKESYTIIWPLEGQDAEPIKQPCILVFDSAFKKDLRTEIIAMLKNYLTTGMRGKMKVERVIFRSTTKKINLIKLKFNRSGILPAANSMGRKKNYKFFNEEEKKHLR